MKKVWIAALAVVALSGALAACETPTPYQAAAPGAQESGGYSDTQIEADRWRVTFRGNSLTSRNTVENYLLYRAAELTVAQGYDWFEAADRHTQTHVETYGDTFGWSPYWRFYRGGYGWGGWGWGGAGPGWRDPFWGPDFDVQTVERYEASVEIVMHHGDKPAGDAKAFDAHQVMSNLAGKIAKPS
jgi:hypothetical protein